MNSIIISMQDVMYTLDLVKLACSAPPLGCGDGLYYCDSILLPCTFTEVSITFIQLLQASIALQWHLSVSIINTIVQIWVSLVEEHNISDQVYKLLL